MFTVQKQYYMGLLYYVPYAPSCLTCLRALLASVPSCLPRLTYSHYLRTLPTFLTCFTRLKTFLGWICIPAEVFNFPNTIKGTTNRAVFCRTRNTCDTFTGKFVKHI